MEHTSISYSMYHTHGALAAFRGDSGSPFNVSCCTPLFRRHLRMCGWSPEQIEEAIGCKSNVGIAAIASGLTWSEVDNTNTTKLTPEDFLSALTSPLKMGPEEVSR